MQLAPAQLTQYQSLASKCRAAELEPHNGFCTPESAISNLAVTKAQTVRKMPYAS
jgi:hypothetical protein